MIDRRAQDAMMAAPRGRWTEIMPTAPRGVTRVRVSETIRTCSSMGRVSGTTISNPSAASIAASSAGLRQRAPERNR
jgi:hypothetical protein